MADRQRAARERLRRRYRRKRAIVVAVAAVVVVGVGSGVGLALTAGSGPSYRVATAGPGSVTQTLASVGTLGTVATSTVSFPIAGTVDAVRVAIGDKVAGGQTVATLDTTALVQNVNSAKSTLATAKQTQASDEANQSSAASTASTSSSSDHTAQSAVERPIGTTSPKSTAPPRGSAPSGSGNSRSAASTLKKAVQQAQHEVTAAQAALDKELSDLGTDLRSLTSNGGACASVAAQSPTEISYTTNADQDGTIAGTAGEHDTVTLFSGGAQVGSQQGAYSFTGLTPGAAYSVKIQPVTPPDSVDATKCADAIGSMIAKYTSAEGAGSDSYLKTLAANLASAEQDLDVAVHNLSAATQGQGGAPSGNSGGLPPSGQSGQSGTSGNGSHGGGSGGAGSQSGNAGSQSGKNNRASTGTSSSGGGANSGGGVARTVTSEQLAADQAAIDAATAQVTAAEQNLDQATLTSPIAGTVAAVGMTPGATVGASSSTATITIVGAGAKQITTTVGLSDVDKVKVGDRANVNVDGVSNPLSGKVSSIGVLSSTTGSTTTYPVKILLDPSKAKVYDGSGAAVSIVVSAVQNVLTVPSSAVHHVAGLSTVSVLKKGKVSTVQVTPGAQGTDLTEIKSGLSAGDQVVLADLGARLPSGGFNATNTRGGLLGGGGVGGGGGRFAGRVTR